MLTSFNSVVEALLSELSVHVTVTVRLAAFLLARITPRITVVVGPPGVVYTVLAEESLQLTNLAFLNVFAIFPSFLSERYSHRYTSCCCLCCCDVRCADGYPVGTIVIFEQIG